MAYFPSILNPFSWVQSEPPLQIAPPPAESIVFIEQSENPLVKILSGPLLIDVGIDVLAENLDIQTTGCLKRVCKQIKWGIETSPAKKHLSSIEEIAARNSISRIREAIPNLIDKFLVENSRLSMFNRFECSQQVGLFQLSLFSQENEFVQILDFLPQIVRSNPEYGLKLLENYIASLSVHDHRSAKLTGFIKFAPEQEFKTQALLLQRIHTLVEKHDYNGNLSQKFSHLVEIAVALVPSNPEEAYSILRKALDMDVPPIDPKHFLNILVVFIMRRQTENLSDLLQKVDQLFTGLNIELFHPDNINETLSVVTAHVVLNSHRAKDLLDRFFIWTEQSNDIINLFDVIALFSRHQCVQSERVFSLLKQKFDQDQFQQEFSKLASKDLCMVLNDLIAILEALKPEDAIPLIEHLNTLVQDGKLDCDLATVAVLCHVVDRQKSRSLITNAIQERKEILKIREGRPFDIIKSNFETLRTFLEKDECIALLDQIDVCSEDSKEWKINKLALLASLYASLDPKMAYPALSRSIALSNGEISVLNLKTLAYFDTDKAFKLALSLWQTQSRIPIWSRFVHGLKFHRYVCKKDPNYQVAARMKIIFSLHVVDSLASQTTSREGFSRNF